MQTKMQRYTNMTDDEYLRYIRTRSLNIETTNKCLLKCPLCERNTTLKRHIVVKKLQESDDISLDNLHKLLNYFPRVNFCGQISDPIYHKNFQEILKICNLYRNTRIVVSTNGSGKTIEWFRECFGIAPKVQWTFALDGLPTSSFEYRINQKSDQVFEVMKEGRALGIYIVWKYIVFSYNEGEIDEAKDIAKKYNMEMLIVKSFRWPNSIKPSNDWQSTEKNGVKYVS